MRKNIMRIYLLLFIAAISVWLFNSNLDFYRGEGGNFPSFLANWPVSYRIMLLNFTSNAYYMVIALGLLIEFFNPRLEFALPRNKFLAGLGVLLIGNALVVGWNNTLFSGNLYYLIDTVIYGLGFGLMFLFMAPQKTWGLSLVLWARLIEVGGFFIGYFFLPAILGMWPEGYTLGHFVRGPAFMFTNYYFWADYITALGSLIGVLILLRRFNFSRFWIVSFSIGSIVVGFNIARYLISSF